MQEEEPVIQKRWESSRQNSFNNYFQKYEAVEAEEKILDFRAVQEPSD